jgi:serine/threonine protein kinase
MTLELCTSGSLMDMHHCRQRFTEPEARFFLVQLTGACHYMHTHHVIHRDLKLSNLLLDGNMNIKVGDFGLAAFIGKPGERETTVCGTLDYMAPEVLFGAPNGYSFEADTWAIGVILFTLVVGQLPFQSNDVKGIKKREHLFSSYRIRD